MNSIYKYIVLESCMCFYPYKVVIVLLKKSICLLYVKEVIFTSNCCLCYFSIISFYKQFYLFLRYFCFRYLQPSERS